MLKKYVEEIHPAYLSFRQDGKRCDSLFLTTNGTPEDQLSDYFKEFTLKYTSVVLTPTRLRQIIQTHVQQKRSGSDFLFQATSNSLTHSLRTAATSYNRESQERSALVFTLATQHGVEEEKLLGKTANGLKRMLVERIASPAKRQKTTARSVEPLERQRATARPAASKRFFWTEIQKRWLLQNAIAPPFDYSHLLKKGIEQGIFPNSSVLTEDRVKAQHKALRHRKKLQLAS